MFIWFDYEFQLQKLALFTGYRDDICEYNFGLAISSEQESRTFDQNSFMATNKSYRLKCGSKDWIITEADIKSTDIIKTGPDSFHIIHNGHSLSAHIESVDLIQRKIKVLIRQQSFEVHIDTPLQQLIDSIGFVAGRRKSNDTLTAPMPGMVLRILVEEGQTIRKGEGLLVLEAMKMENVLKAADDGVVAKLVVKPLDKVDKGQTLIEFGSVSQ